MQVIGEKGLSGLVKLMLDCVFIGGMAIFITFLTIILAMVFIIAGLFLIILSEVFRQAVIVKQENDLTI